MPGLHVEAGNWETIKAFIMIFNHFIMIFHHFIRIFRRFIKILNHFIMKFHHFIMITKWRHKQEFYYDNKMTT